MGLWSKGIERSKIGIPHIEENIMFKSISKQDVMDIVWKTCKDTPTEFDTLKEILDYYNKIENGK